MLVRKQQSFTGVAVLYSKPYLRARLLIGIVALCISPAATPQNGATSFDAPRSSVAGQKNQKTTATAKRPSGRKAAQLELSGNQHWLDTGIDLAPGDLVLISGSGTMQLPDATESNGPEGHARGWRDLLRQLPLNEAGRAALVARIGSNDGAQLFLVGAKRELRATQSGRLFVGLNLQPIEDAEGKYTVKVEVLSREGSAASGAVAMAPGRAITAQQMPGLSADLFQKIPRRVTDKDGNLGDMVNFIILGSEEKVRQAFDSGGWVTVDRTQKDAVLHAILATISKQAYVQLPMSELYLFGRPQDFGYAHAEPFQVVSSRHHLRLWKAPFTVEGQAVWVGAATHDIGFDRDKRDDGVTHKIDPAVDLERDYIRDSLRQTGTVSTLTYIKPAQAVKEAETASGASFHSDGQVLILKLAGSSMDRSAGFADLFCTVLQQEHPDPGQWGPCSQYLTDASGQAATLGAIPNTYRLLIVPGVLSSCASATPAYHEGIAYLREKFGLSAEVLPVPNESSESNGELIARYLKEQSRNDPRKFILLGYSKGAPDIQVGLANDSQAAAKVAAFISVAGAVGGSPIADELPGSAERWIRLFHFGQCEGDLTAAFRSLRRDERRNFLAAHPEPVVPSYSVAAVADQGTTSKMLLENWQLLNIYDVQHDSQVIKDDAIVPGGRYLGTVRADHFAVALPFEFLKDAEILKMVDKNHFPRTALLEALLRFVIQDLQGAPAPPR